MSLALIGGTSWQMLVAAQSEPIEVRVSEAGATIRDPEIDQRKAQFVWYNPTEGVGGEVWIGKIDPVTGDFTPPSGKAIFVDMGAAFIVGNGPEWVYTSIGPQIVYTKFDSENEDNLARARSTDGCFTWTARFLRNGHLRHGPIGSSDPGDPFPRISYVATDPNGNLVTMWRNLNDPSTEEIVPGSSTPGGRWVPGRRALVLTEPMPEGGRQAFMYDVDTKVLEQLTHDGGVKSAVFMWRAPEFNNAYVFLTLINETHIGIYGKINGVWTRINTVKPPSIGNFLWSPEPFVHNGKSYIVMVTSTSSDQQSFEIPTDLWLAGIDRNAPFYRQLSDLSAKVRKDPEVFITQNGPFIYYAVLNPENPEETGIYRVDSGLGPPQ
jgi:hypothetical protein